MSKTSPATRISQPSLVGDRYRTEDELGSGGMGTVVRALDLSTNKRVALKRLRADAKRSQLQLFEREYHTLAGIKHPHVVEVFDYGRDEQGPYYAMELLSGSDIESLAPLPWPVVCRILRDVASGLSLLHARCLVHRDVSARNIWQTEDGLIKLIDFGTLAAFGRASDIAGTPPYVAPEALDSQQLDQRTDLFSVGALGYWLLTGRHAFPARSLGELPEQWLRTPRVISELVRDLQAPGLSEVPAGLDTLIESLLSRDPAARPASAAELIDRLHALTPLESEVRVGLVEGFLGSKAFVGRTREKRRIRVALAQTVDELGGSVLIEGPTASGRSRLLSEAVLEARVAGVTALWAAGSEERTNNGVMAACALRLLDALPTLARSAARPLAPVLGHLSPQIAQRLEVGELEVMPETPGEARMRIQGAMRDWFIEVSRERPLALLIDDLHLLDESSAGFVAALAREATGSRILVIATLKQGDDVRLGGAAQAMSNSSMHLRLSPLQASEALELLRSMFGEALHLARLAEHLMRTARGNPGHLVELAEYVVRQRLVNYADGEWILPQDISELVLPKTHTDVLRSKLLQLSSESRTLGQSLSHCEGTLSLDMAAAVSHYESARLFAGIEDLVRAGVLIGLQDGYQFSDPALRQILADETDASARTAVHLALGEWILRNPDPSDVDKLRASLHLFRAGATKRASTIAARAALSFGLVQKEERTLAIPLIEEILPFFRESAQSDYETVGLVATLATNAYFVDRRLAFEHGDEALAVLQRILGLDLARKLRPYLGRKLSLYVGLIWGNIGFRRHRDNVLVPSFQEAMTLFVGCVGFLSGTFALCIDPARVIRCAEKLEPLTVLGKDHVVSIVHGFAVGCGKTNTDKPGETQEHWQRLIERLDDPRPVVGMPEHMRPYYLAGSLYCYGVTEAWRDNSRALEIADRLEQQVLKLYHVSAHQIRAIYYANQGDMAASAKSVARIEICALQRGLTWQVELWAPGGAITYCRRVFDAMGMKQASEQLKHLSVDTPSLENLLRRARSTYLLMRGRYPEALEAVEEVARLNSPTMVGWSSGQATHAEVCNHLGDHAKARSLCEKALADLSPADLRFTALTLNLQVQLALAEAGLGRHGLAAEQLDALLSEHEQGKGPLTLGALHEARAEVARLAGDSEAQNRHEAEMERWYRGTGTASLIQYCDRRAKARNRGRGADGELKDAPLERLRSLVQRVSTTESESPSFHLCLDELMSYTAAYEGHFFILEGEQLRCTSGRGSKGPSDALLAWVSERIKAAANVTFETEDAEAGEILDPNRFSHNDRIYRLSYLSIPSETGEKVCGAVVLDSRRPLDLPAELVQLLTERLLDRRSMSEARWSVVSSIVTSGHPF